MNYIVHYKALSILILTTTLVHIVH